PVQIIDFGNIFYFNFISHQMTLFHFEASILSYITSNFSCSLSQLYFIFADLQFSLYLFLNISSLTSMFTTLASSSILLASREIPTCSPSTILFISGKSQLTIGTWAIIYSNSLFEEAE